MELTPQAQALETQLTQSPLICELQETDEKLLKGQKGIQEHLSEVDDRLEDGSRVMAELKSDIKGLSGIFNNHVMRTEQMHQEIKSEIKDNKFKDVTAELKNKNEEIEAIKTRFWGGVKMILNGVISIIVGGAVVYFFK